jgi:hypothetical protein
MEIVNFGHFTRQNSTGVIFYQNEDGQDWYELRSGLTSWSNQGDFIDAVYGAWAMVDPVTGVVTNVEFDPSRMVPDNKIVLGIDADVSEILPGMIYSEGVLLPVPDPVDPVPDEISRRQFFQELAISSLITQAEALAAVKTREIPAAMMAFISALDPSQQFDAQMLITGADSFRRSHLLVDSFGAAQGMSAAQIDDLWRRASLLV